jgi:hypothetical protein
MTAKTIDDIFNFMSKDKAYEEILKKHLSNKNERDEFRQVLHLQLCEHNRDKLIDYWNRGEFKWVYIKIVSNNIKSKTSIWHLTHRQNNEILTDNFFSEYENLFDSSEEEDENEVIRKNKIQLIDNAISILTQKSPLLIKEFILFNMYYKDGLNFKKIAEKTKIKIDTVYYNVKKAERLIIKEIKKHK